MSTIEKNIYTIQDKLTKLKPKSRVFLKYNGRLLKKIEQYKRFIETRTREESLLIKDTLQNGEILIEGGEVFFNNPKN